MSKNHLIYNYVTISCQALRWQTVIQFSELVKGLPEDEPIFVKGKVYNSTVNDILSRHCKALNLSEISIHGLRHTHASLLLFAGVPVATHYQLNERRYRANP